MLPTRKPLARPAKLTSNAVSRRGFLQTAAFTAIVTGFGPRLLGCSAAEPDSGAAQATEPLKFVVISDTHVRLPGSPDDQTYDNQGNINNLIEVVSRINNDYADVAFVAVTGDLVGCLLSDDPEDYLVGKPNPAETFRSIMDVLTMPWFAALGNHDYQKGYDVVADEGIMTDDLARIEAIWRKVLLIEPYYSKVVQGHRLVFLNSSRGSARKTVCEGNQHEAFCTGSFDEEQLLWLEQELEQPQPCILFFHHPIHTDNVSRLWTMMPSFHVESGDRFYEIIDACRDRIRGVFTGHGHLWAKDFRAGTIPVFETCAVGDHNGSGENFHVATIDSAGVLEVVKGNEAGRYM